jgi:hypothetical protein
MNLEEYKVVFAVATLALILVGATPAISAFLSFPNDTNRFSELWVLGPAHVMHDYPLEVNTNTDYQIFLGVGNHMHSSSYYMVNVKFRNQTQPSPDSLSSTPSSLPALYQYMVFVGDEQIWETNFTFRIVDLYTVGNSTLIGNVSINGENFLVNSPTAWDSQNGGFYYQVFFELWLYNITTQSFQYDNRSVWIWLKVNP